MFSGRLRGAARTGTSDGGLVVICGVVGVAELALLVAVGNLAPVVNVPGDLPQFALYRLGLVVAVALALPGAYAVHREGIALRQSPRRAGAALREHGPRLVASSLVARLVALVATVAVFAVCFGLLLGVDTALVWSDAVLGIGAHRPTVFEWGFVLAAVLAAWLVNGLLAYQDLLVIDGRAGVLGAWRASATAVAARPRWYLGQAMVRGLLLAVAPIAAFLLLVVLHDVVGVPTETSLPAQLIAAAVFVGTTGLARATLVAYHVETMGDVVRPALERDPSPVRENVRGIALAAVLVLAAIGGVAAVRAGDIQPAPNRPDATIDPADPAASVETAVAQTQGQSRTVLVRMAEYDAANATWETNSNQRVRVDPARERMHYTIAMVDDGDRRNWTLYATDGMIAARGEILSLSAAEFPQMRRSADPWEMVVGYSYADTREFARFLPEARGNWSLRSANASTVVYAITDPQDFEDVSRGLVPTQDPDSEHITYEAESELRLVIDRERAVVRRYVAHVHYRDSFDPDDIEVEHRKAVVTYDDVGAVTVRRPESLGGPGALETFWDVVFYE